MNKITESSKEIYDLLGSGYGFNGSKEEAIKLLDENITEVAKYYADKAFVAGRSKTPWKVFYVSNFLSGSLDEFHPIGEGGNVRYTKETLNNHEKAMIELGVESDGTNYVNCIKCGKGFKNPKRLMLHFEKCNK